VQFRKTLLRVGSPFAECDPESTMEESWTFGKSADFHTGAIIPAFYGHPNLNLPKYEELAVEVSKTTVPVRVVLEIFDEKIKSVDYTASEEEETSKKTSKGGKYSSCYEAGNACPEDHKVCKPEYCEMNRWEYIIAELRKNDLVEVLGAVGAGTTSAEYAILDEKVNGFFYKEDGEPDDIAADSVLPDTTPSTVYVLGEPLLVKDEADMDDVNTLVTLADDNLGVWNPYSWYPHVNNAKWAAILTGVEVVNVSSTIRTLFDRGYGWVYMTASTGTEAFEATNKEYLQGVLYHIGAYTPGRRLQETEESKPAETAYEWGCDDTRFHCSPVCLSHDGPVTSITSDEKCADAPKDLCHCKCYYDAAWTCHEGEVVCQASKGIEAMIVGDLLCENRGTRSRHSRS
jgi:hypothetical protein